MCLSINSGGRMPHSMTGSPRWQRVTLRNMILKRWKRGLFLGLILLKKLAAPVAEVGVNED